MRCQDMLPLVEKLADGECTPSEMARAEAHLKVCDSCRAHFRFLEALPGAARRAPLPEPPEMYWDVLPRKVMARIDQRRSAAASPAPPARWLRLTGLGWLGALAAAVIAVFVGLEVGTFRESDLAVPSIAKKEDSAEPPKPVLGSEVEKPDRQPLVSTVPAVPGVAGEARQARRIAPEPSFKDEPAEASPGPPATPARGGDPSLRQAERLAPQKGDEQEPVGVSPVPPGDRHPQVEGLASRTQAAAGSRDEIAVLAGEEKELAVGRTASPPPASATVEGQALQEEIAPDRRTKEEAFLTPGEPARKRRSATYQTLSTQKSSRELQAECQALRTSLARNLEVEQALDTRYRLALCSIRLFKSLPSEQTRQQAVEDGNAFLELSPEGEKADEVRKELDSIKN